MNSGKASVSIETKLKESGIVLPTAPKPVANYVPAARVGELLFTSGVLPMKEGRLAYEGKLGKDLTPEQGQEAARLALLNALAVVKQEAGSLERVVRIVRLTGHVASAPGFVLQSTVLNGASDLLVAIFGEAGRHTRAALGAAELPLNSPIELELIVQVRP
ncbi:MAG TPA: RidA family protein [Nitrospiria bacterium]|nr:RidA family protein [Nitrospiria bacterium]